MRSEEDSRTIKIYYDQASQHGLLSREEEVKLFEEFHKWRDNKSNWVRGREIEERKLEKL